MPLIAGSKFASHFLFHFLHHLSHFLIADSIGEDAQVGHIGLCQVFITAEWGTANPTVGWSTAKDLCQDGHVVIATDELAVKVQFAPVSLLAV